MDETAVAREAVKVWLTRAIAGFLHKIALETVPALQ